MMSFTTLLVKLCDLMGIIIFIQLFKWLSIKYYYTAVYTVPPLSGSAGAISSFKQKHMSYQIDYHDYE